MKSSKHHLFKYPLDAVATSDVGSTLYVNISQFVSSTNFTTTPALSVQSGANEGDSIAFDLQSATASALRISNVNVISSSDNFNTLASVNLQALEWTIPSLNVAQTSTEYTKDQLLINFGISLLSQANTNSQTVLSLF